jgi:alpha-N-arabinofuranosidase
MLEDRKFYFPITADYAPYRYSRDVPRTALIPVVGASPWQIIGPSDSVRMIEQDAFVGRHTPQIAPGSGIRQNDLGLVEGKQYRYIWLKKPAMR